MSPRARSSPLPAWNTKPSQWSVHCLLVVGRSNGGLGDASTFDCCLALRGHLVSSESPQTTSSFADQAWEREVEPQHVWLPLRPTSASLLPARIHSPPLTLGLKVHHDSGQMLQLGPFSEVFAMRNLSQQLFHTWAGFVHSLSGKVISLTYRYLLSLQQSFLFERLVLSLCSLGETC